MTGRRLLLAALLAVVASLVVAALWPVVASLWDDPWDGGDLFVVRADGPYDRPDPGAWTTLVDLHGTWAFRIGDDSRWAEPGASTAGWDEVVVPGAWEDAGYHGYDGFAWYRRSFRLDADAAKRVRAEPATLLLGRIDDADEVWLNGTFLGRGGRMPPGYATASFGFRTYPVPPDLLRPEGENVVAVRVYDGGLEGGILEGPVALVVPTAENPASVPLVADLAGGWRFRPGDDPAWAAPDTDDGAWTTIRVPGVWEAQGFPDLDGIAWYRTTVRLTAEQAAQDLVLVLGAVDDLDEAYVNGVLVGRTGDVASRSIQGDEWLIKRGYPVPPEALRAGDNTVAVRVYDGLIDGGIHLGPVGLMTAEAYAEWAERQPR